MCIRKLSPSEFGNCSGFVLNLIIVVFTKIIVTNCSWWLKRKIHPLYETSEWYELMYSTIEVVCLLHTMFPRIGCIFQEQHQVASYLRTQVFDPVVVHHWYLWTSISPRLVLCGNHREVKCGREYFPKCI